MIKVTLLRSHESGAGTIGNLYIGDAEHRVLWTLEPPWRDNKEDVSRIPAGIYKCVPHGWNGELVQYKKVWRIVGVPNRTSILFHEGNWPHNTKGCILMGLSYNGSIEDPAVYNSVKARDIMRALIGNAPFMLEIVDQF